MSLKSCNTSCRKKRKLRKTVVDPLLSSPKTIHWYTLTSAKIDALWNSLSFFQFWIKLEILNGKIGQANGSCKKEDAWTIFHETMATILAETATKQALGNEWAFYENNSFCFCWSRECRKPSINHNLFELQPHKIIRPFYQPFQVTLALTAFTLVLLFTCPNFWVLLSASTSSW